MKKLTTCKASDEDTTLESTDSENHSNSESTDESDSLSDTSSGIKKRKTAGKKKTLGTSFQNQQSADDSEIVTDAIDVEKGGKDTVKNEKRSPKKTTKVRVHPKISKPRSQNEAMIQVAKSIESSIKEQEKNRDER